MPFKLNGEVIDITRDLTIGDGDQAITYPAGSLQNADLRRQLGITEEADTPRADDRYYWNGDINTPKDLADLKALQVSDVKASANALLQPTDWIVTRKIERGIEIPADVATYRAAVISAADANEAAISATNTVAELAEVVVAWPERGGVTDD